MRRVALVAATSALITVVFPAGAFARSARAPLSASDTLRISPGSISLGDEHVGSFFVGRFATVTNASDHTVTLERVEFAGGDESDFVVGTDCLPHGHPLALAAGRSCSIKVVFTPHAFGARSATLRIAGSASASQSVRLSGIGTVGYYLADRRGGVSGFGDAEFHGRQKSPRAPIISITSTSTGAGYWMLDGFGDVYAFGDAHFFGSTGARRLSRPVVGMASLRANKGYWLVASDGGIFSFGRAHFYGSTGGMRLNQPIVGMAATRTGKGYWLVARDGGIFSFGDAKFYGSTGAVHLAQPIVGMVRTPSGNGYWLFARDGGVFTFGDARYSGSGGGQRFGDVAGMASTPDGRGYWLSNTAGQVFVFGDAPYFGDSFRRAKLPVVGMAATAPTSRPVRAAHVIDEPDANALQALLSDLARPRSLP